MGVSTINYSLETSSLHDMSLINCIFCETGYVSKWENI
jgi:hypothetical protein